MDTENIQDGAGAVDTEASEGANVADDGSNASTEPDNQAEAQDAEAGNENSESNDDDGVVEIEGKKYVLQDRVQSRIDELTAARKQAEEALMSGPSKQFDPETFRASLVEDLKKLQKPSVPSETVSIPSQKLEKFVAEIKDEGTRTYTESLLEHLNGAYVESLNQQRQEILQHVQQIVAPMMTHYGKQIYADLTKKYPDFTKYAQPVEKLMTEYPGLTAEKAYHLASWEDKVKGAAQVGAKKEQQRQQKMKQSPATNKSPGGKPTITPAKTAQEAVKRAFDSFRSNR